MLVFIVGYMGAGKSSVGAALAKALNFRFVDTDDWIEARCCKTITQIFNDLGEKEFRDMEKECLEFLIDQDHFVVATGGGLPCHNNLMELMNEMGETVFLDAAEETLLKRLELQTEQRPLLHSNQSLSKIITSQLAERISTYVCAKHTLQVNEKPILSIVQELQFLLQNPR